jgi:4-amino-4-deoxy-L-arabinose transferase-like glycosyltransferase/Flp pilus assembly protein TadD
MARHPRKPAAAVEPASPLSTTRLRSRWAVALGLLVVLAVKLVVLFQLGDHSLLQPRGVLDDAVYLKLAQRVAGGDLLLGPDVYYLSPFYTYFLGLILALGGSVFTARVVQVTLGVASVLLVGLTARRLWGERAGWFAAASTALTGLFTFNEILLLQSSVDPFLAALALWALGRAVGQASRLPDAVGQASRLPTRAGGSFFLTGVAFGLLCLNRPNALAAAVVVAAAWLVIRRSREAALQVAAAIVGLCVVIAPVTVRNRVVAGDWTLITSHGGLNFYIGNHEGASGTWTTLPGISPSIEGQSRDAARVASAAMGRPVSAGEASNYFFDLGRRWILGHPLEAARLWLRKVALAFTNTDLALNYSFTYYARDERTLLGALVVGPWFLVPLGLVGLVLSTVWQARRLPHHSARRLPHHSAGRLPHPPGERLPNRAALLAWSSFVPGYAASLVVFFVASRYRLPMLVALAVGSGFALDFVIAAVTDRCWRAVATVCASAAVLGAATLLPIEPDSGRFFERGERVVQLIAAGQDDEGERLLRDTEADYPQRALLLYRVGQAWQQRGQGAKAVPAFERARSADPASVEILLALAGSYRSAGRGDDAVKTVGAVTRLNDAVPADVVEFGAALLAGGDLSLAEQVARLAAVRWPTSSPSLDLLGLALMLQDKRPEGEAALREAVRLDPASASAHYHLAQAVAVAGRTAEAIVLLEETLRLRPDYPEAQRLWQRLQGR